MLVVCCAHEFACRCHEGSHVRSTASTQGAQLSAMHLAMTRARYILNALSLGYGVLYVDPAVQLQYGPLTALLARPEDVVQARAASASGGPNGGDDGGEGRASSGEGVGCKGQDTVSGEAGVLLFRPSVAAARCAYDWVVAIRHAFTQGDRTEEDDASSRNQFAAIMPDCVRLFGTGYALLNDTLAFASCGGS